MKTLISLLILLTSSLQLPFDTWMERYPEWMDKWSPILLECEPTHFYGYFQTPSGDIKAMWTDTPVKSWHLEYNLGYPSPEPYWFMGHRIKGAFLDGVESPVHYIDCSSSDSIMKELHEASGLPMLDIRQTSYSRGDKAVFMVRAANPSVKVYSPSGEEVKISLEQTEEEVFEVKCKLRKQGLYNITVEDGRYVANGSLIVHRRWEDCLRIAREAAVKYRQQPTSCVESWYGYYSAFLAAKYFPDAGVDSLLNRRFDTFREMMYADDMSPKYYKKRIQNTACTIGMFTDRFQAYGNREDLERASMMADWLIQYSQAPNGAYMKGRTMYTSVAYIAKSMLELYLVEKDIFPEAARRHYESAKRAIDHLVESDGNFQTEGELTFEDGMISCSALQIGFFALLQEDAAVRKHYTDAMLKLLDSHDCLTQLVVPDARRRGGTFRFWEAQYDVLMMPNMITSPHGWSAWRAYATWYAWLLTGEDRWIRETWNAMGAFSGLISPEGKLRWAFVVDPDVEARQVLHPVPGFNPDSLSFGNAHPDMFGAEPIRVGKQYIDMIGDWQTLQSCDNDVHEVFKFLCESFLTRAAIATDADGNLHSYNCRYFRLGRHVWVRTPEKQIRTLDAYAPGYKLHFRGEINEITPAILPN